MRVEGVIHGRPHRLQIHGVDLAVDTKCIDERVVDRDLIYSFGLQHAIARYCRVPDQREVSSRRPVASISAGPEPLSRAAAALDFISPNNETASKTPKAIRAGSTEFIIFFPFDCHSEFPTAFPKRAVVACSIQVWSAYRS